MGRPFILTAIAALALAALPGVTFAAPAPDGAVAAPSSSPATAPRTIPAPSDADTQFPDTEPDAAGDGETQDLSAPHTSIPDIHYGTEGLPESVRLTRQKIIEAALTGEPDALSPVFEANSKPVDLGANVTDDPVGYLRHISGDEGGREVLAVLIEVLEAGYVIADEGTPDEVYVWPYFARYPVDELTPPQLVELFRVVYAGDYQDMLDYGFYTSFRVGIKPDGTWDFFLTD